MDLRFVSETPEISGRVELAVLTSRGCERFNVRTVFFGSDQRGSSHPLGVDLGTTSPGSVGEPVDIVFTAAGGNSESIFMTAGVSDDVFEIVDPIEPTRLVSCEPLTTSVRLNASREVGVYEGQLFYEILTETTSGIGAVDLRGRVE